MKSKLFLLLLVGLLAVAMIAGCQPTAVDDAVDDDADENGEVVEEEIIEVDHDGEVYTIAALYPLTGGLSTYGQNNTEAAKLAAVEVNEWLEAEGKDWRLRLVVDDTQQEPAVGLRKMQSWYGDGVSIFAGPMASGVAQEMLSFANSNQILFVSPSATSPALSIPDDFLFRFCTDDGIQGPAIAALAEAAGIEHMIFAWRGDTWGDGLQWGVENALEDLGIEVYPQKISYDPQKEEFTTETALIDGYIDDLVEQGVSLDKIGINLIAFEEAAPFMAEAANYDQLRSVIWFGSDGTAQSEALRAHETAAPFAAEVKFISTMNRPEDAPESKQEHVRDTLYDILGRDVEAYTYNTYDIIWSLALAMDEVGDDPVAVKEILARVTDEYTSVYGASGHIILNEAGDRGSADFDYFLFNDDLAFEFVGYYETVPQVLHWDSEVY